MKRDLPKTRKPPPDLTLEARSWWKNIADAYEFSDSDLELLNQAARLRDRLHAALALVAKDGDVVVDRFGQTKKNPAVECIATYSAAFLRTFRALGLDLSPSDEAMRPGEWQPRVARGA